MANVLKSVENVKINNNLVELLIAGVVKYYTERLLANTFVGNGTFKSGAYKLGIGIGVDLLTKGKGGILKSGANVIKTAMVMDGVEDITKNAMDRYAPNILGVSGANTNMVETI